MLKKQITVGGLYRAKVSGKVTTVRVDAIREVSKFAGTGYNGRSKYKEVTVYDVTNLTTGRKTFFRSAQKFRSVAGLNDPAREVQRAKTETDKLNEKNARAIAAQRTGAAETAELQEQVRRGEKTAGQALQEKCRAKPTTLADSFRKTPALAPAPKKSKYPPTPEQRAIMDEASKGTPIIMIEAGAGTGKTTTDRMLVDVLRGRGQYTAFNKSLVVDSAGKFRGTPCQCNTTHSLAFRAIGAKYAHRLGGNRVRAGAIAKLLGIDHFTLPPTRDTDGKEMKGKALAAMFMASHVLGAIRNFCQSADREIGAKHFKYLDGIDQPENGKRTSANNDAVKEYLVPFARKAWEDIADPDGQMPFSHDHYVKLWQLDNPVISADYILLDEAQDTAPVMLDILSQQVGPGREHPPQVILVGDSAQQIYEWRGAVNALGAFPGAPRLYLSQSFRFGQAIAEVANAVLELLQERTELRLRGFDQINSTILRGATTEKPTAILCRTNAMAIGYLLSAIAEGRHPFLVGGGAHLISFVEGARSLQQTGTTSHPELACFSSWSELQEYVSIDEGKDLQLMVKLNDEFGCDTILSALKGMPQEADADLTISTAHKSKGREWDYVKLAPDFPTKSKCGDPELKLLYVAITRAKETLDVSECPFFTGDDSMDISKIISNVPRPTVPSAQPAPPTQLTNNGHTKFTWRKWEGTWCVQGPYDMEGETVDVYRKDGSCQQKRLGKPLAEFQDATVYKID